jgi:acetyl esterase/lipase
MRAFQRISILIGLACLSAPALAGSMPPDIAEKLQAMGRKIVVPETNALYAPLHPMEPYPGIKLTRDLKYGPADRNRLDVFQAEGATGARPVLLFVHGGGYIRGDKKTPNSPFLDNIPVWAARNGMVGVNMTYRLAPQSTWPSGPQDMGAAVKWVRDNIASHGGDPARIYLMGWSAGGGHVASYVAFPEYHTVPGSGLAGAILLSGSPFDATVFPDMANYKQYFGEDTSKYPSFSAQPGLLKSSVPLMVAWAGLDPPSIEAESINLSDALCKAQKCPTKVYLKTHSHISSGNSIGTSDTELSDQIAAFVKSGGKATN